MKQASSEIQAQRGLSTETLSVMPAEFGALYQAGYDAGFSSGREAGYRQGYSAGYAEGHHACTPIAAAQPAAGTSGAGARRRGLLGLPCEKCSTFLFSDETQCPHCKTSPPSQKV